jgi:hypothetical protein
MTTRVDQRDMTRGEVEAMPPSLLRDILLGSLLFQQAGRPLSHDDRKLPILCQYLGGPRLGAGTHMWPRLISNPEALPAHQLISEIADQMEEDTDWWEHFVYPDARGGGAFLAVGIVYDDWMASESHPHNDGRDPADLPDSIPTRFVRGVTASGAGFCVFGPMHGEWRARVELVAELDAELDDATSMGSGVDRHLTIRRSLLRAARALDAAYAHYATDPAAYPPPYEPDPSPLVPDTSEPQGAHAVYGEPVSRDQAEAFVDSPLRRALIDSFTFEAAFQRESGWDTMPSRVIRFRVHGERPHQSIADCVLISDVHSPSDRLTLLYIGLVAKGPIRADPDFLEGRYVGTAIVIEVADVEDGAMTLADASVSGAQARVILGVLAASGEWFALIRRRCYQPMVTVFKCAKDAAAAIGGDIVDYVAAMNKAFITRDSSSDIGSPPSEHRRPASGSGERTRDGANGGESSNE